MFRSGIKNNKGIALMMALMIMSVAMLTGLFLNSIITNEIKISLNTTNVINSYYAAESGIERALYYLTTDALSDHIAYYEDLSDLDVSGNRVEYPLANGASYTFAATSIRAAKFTAINVSNTNPAHVSVLDPSGNISSILWSGQVSVASDLKWLIDDCFPSHASDRMETTIYSFASQFSAPDIYKTISVCDCSKIIKSCRNIKFSDLSPNRYYRFVFRPLDTDVNYLEFSLTGEDILSEAFVQADGRYKNSEYRLQARMSALSPASDIFSFVIFSEEEINKEQ